MGIVLDTGGAMINAWNNGEVLIDLLFDSEKNPEVYQFGRKRDVTFEIIRYGK
jgi:3D (Asp-Asp-Asp) domain-containing protein